jgi:PAS domain S-box-containing protein
MHSVLTGKPATHAFLAGGGEMGARIRAHDWASTPLGPPGQWPQSLRSALSICLHSSFPTAIYWGPGLRLLYNDAWAPVPAERHPWALGRPAPEVWADIWSVVAPQMRQVLETGEGFSTFDQMLPIERDGLIHETFWNYSLTPIRGEDGSVTGIFNQGHEVTDRVLGERRGRFLFELSDRLRALSDPRAIIATAQEALGRHLRASRVGYGEVDETARHFTTERNWTDGSVPSREGTHDLAAFGPAVLDALRAGETLLLPDVDRDPRSAAPGSRAAFDAIDTRAVITASLVKEGRLRAALYVHAREPRAWTGRDAELVVEVAERSWSAIERARAEIESGASAARVRESEARFRNMADHAPVMMWVTDASGHCVHLNRLWYDFTGQTPEEAEGFGWLDATHPEDRARAEEAFVAANASRTPFRIDYRLRCADGSYRWTIDAASPRFDERGEFLGYVGSVIDIQERHESEAALRLSEQRFRAAVDAIEGILWTNDAEGRMVGDQPGWARLTGQGPAEYGGHGWADAVHPDDREASVLSWTEAVARGGPYVFEHRVRRHDGAWRHFAIRAIPVLAHDGSVQEWVGVHTDVTEARAAERRLRESEARAREVSERLQLALDAGAVAGTWFWDVRNDRLTADERFARTFGLDPASCASGLPIGLALASIHPDDRERVGETIRQALARGGDYRCEYRICRRDSCRWVEAAGRVELDAEGRALRFPGVLVDIDERKTAENRLRESERRFRLMANAVPQIVWITDAEGRTEFFNQQWFDYTGAERRLDTAGQVAANYLHPDDAAPTMAAFEAARRGGGTFLVEHRIRAHTGEYRWFLVRGEPQTDPEGRVLRWFGASVDIHDRREAEVALRAERDRAQRYLQVAEVMILVLDEQGVIRTINRRGVEILGHASDAALVGRDWFEVAIPAADRAGMRAAFARIIAGEVEALAAYENPVLRADGTERLVAWRNTLLRDAEGRIIGTLSSGDDVTDQRMARERERLLAQEIDHRAKNLLAVVQSVVQLTRAEDMRGFKEAVTGRIQSLARTHGLLAAARWEGADLRQLVSDELAPYARKDTARAEISGPALRLTPAAAQAMALVIHELATNSAKYGSLSAPGGQVRVGWGRGTGRDARFRLRWEEAGGPAVAPPKRRGFGSVVLQSSVERQLHGEVHLDWRAEGLVCELSVPVEEMVVPTARMDAPNRVDIAAAPPVVARGRALHVLVLEDEALVAAQIEDVLAGAGHAVTGASRLPEAFDRLYADPPDAALLDINLGGQRSYGFAELLAAKGVPFAFCSGYGESAELPGALRGAPMLAKPFDPAELLRVVETLRP